MPTPTTTADALILLRELQSCTTCTTLARLLARTGYAPAESVPWQTLLPTVSSHRGMGWELAWLHKRVRTNSRRTLIEALGSPKERTEMLRAYYGTEQDFVRALHAALERPIRSSIQSALIKAELGRMVALEDGRSAASSRAWLEAQGIAGLVDRPVGELVRPGAPPDVGKFAEFAGERSVAQALDAETYTSNRTWPRSSRKTPPAVKDHLVRLLCEAACHHRLAADQELDEPPDLQRWPNLAAASSAARRALDELEQEVGREWALDRIEGSLHIELEPPLLTWRPQARGHRHSVEVRLQPRLSMQLVGSGAVPYRAGRAALRAVANRLSQRKAEDGRLGPLEVDLGRQPVDRLIEQLLGEQEESSAEVGWGLRRDRDGLWLSPLWCTERPAGGLKLRLVKGEEIDDLVAAADPDRDLGAVTALLGLHATRYAHSASALREALHDPPRVALALDRLRGHPRVFLQIDGEAPLTIRREAVHLSVQRDDRGDVLLQLHGECGPLPAALGRTIAQDDAVGAPYLHLEGATATLWAVQPRHRRALRALQRHGDRWLPDAEDTLMAAVPQLQQDMGLSLSTDLAGAPVPPDSRLVARLELLPDGLSLALRTRPLPDGGVHLPGRGAPQVYGTRGEGRVHCQRDQDAERRSLSGLIERLELPPDDGHATWHLEGEDAAECISQLREGDDVVLEWTGRRAQVRTSGGIGRLRLAFRSLGSWFGLDGSLADENGDVSLQDLLLAVEQGRRFVRLKEGDWLRLDEALRGSLEAAAGALRDGLDGQLSALHAPALEPLREEGADVDAPSAWWDNLSAIDAAAASTPEVPASLDATLRPYQVDGFCWMTRLASWAGGAVLADDMGLGKTVQTLALLLQRADEPTLVVAPASVGWNWRREAERFAPSLRPVEYRGPERAAALEGIEGGDVLITSWDLFARDIDVLREHRWGTVVFDEAQAMKNRATRRNRAARRIEAGFRLALTGTPVENRASDLHALFSVVLPGLLGTAEAFRGRYELPVQRGVDGATRSLARLISPFVLRRTKAEVLDDLPPRSEIRRTVTLSAPERRLYERVRGAGLAQLALAESSKDPRDRVRVLALLTRLRQAACHPRLVEPESSTESTKSSAVVHLLESLRSEGHAVLVFSQFVRHLELVRDELLSRGFRLAWLTGSTPTNKRRQEVDRFQAGDADAFLISIKAGGTGLNLTAASYVVHLDPWWNPAVEDQATDRAHRIGQDKKVTVYRFVAEETVEEQILELHAQKRALVAGLLAGAGSTQPLTTAELIELLRHQGGEPEVEEVVAVPSAEPEAEEVVTAPPAEPEVEEVVTAPPAEPNEQRGRRRWTSLVEALDAELERSGTSPATARSYGNVARELVRWFEHDGVEGAAWTELEESVERLRAALKDGTWTGRKTAFHQGRAMLRRLRKLDERSGR